MIDKLEEVDLLKLRLNNRDIDTIGLQIELLNGKMREANAALTALTEGLREKYSIGAADQVNMNDGAIIRAENVPVVKSVDNNEEPEEVTDESDED